MSVDTGPLWMPYSAPCRANQFAFALRITFLLGKQAMFGHDPPMYFRSTTAVRWPACAMVHVTLLSGFSTSDNKDLVAFYVRHSIRLRAFQMAVRPPSTASFAP